MAAGWVSKLRAMIEAGDSNGFYDWRAWDRVKAEVLRLDHYECQRCKARGRYKRAEIVHHVQHLKDRPDLALSIWDGGRRQLVSLCRACHEEEHPERKRQLSPRYGKAVTRERWD